MFMRCAASSTVSRSSLIAGSFFRILLTASCRTAVVRWSCRLQGLFGFGVFVLQVEAFGDLPAQDHPIRLNVDSRGDVDGFPHESRRAVIACLVGRPAVGVGWFDA